MHPVPRPPFPHHHHPMVQRHDPPRSHPPCLSTGRQGGRPAPRARRLPGARSRCTATARLRRQQHTGHTGTTHTPKTWRGGHHLHNACTENQPHPEPGGLSATVQQKAPPSHLLPNVPLSLTIQLQCLSPPIPPSLTLSAVAPQVEQGGEFVHSLGRPHLLEGAQVGVVHPHRAGHGKQVAAAAGVTLPGCVAGGDSRGRIKL